MICDGPTSHRFDPPMGLEAVLIVPAEAVRTEQAAGPRCRPPSRLANAVFNVGLRIRADARSR